MHNHETTSYYLILKKMERGGEIDKARYFSGENFIGYVPGSGTTSILKSKAGSKMSATQSRLRQASTASDRARRMERQYLTEKQKKELQDQMDKRRTEFYLNQDSSEGSPAAGRFNRGKQETLYNIEVNSEGPADSQRNSIERAPKLPPKALSPNDPGAAERKAKPLRRSSMHRVIQQEKPSQGSVANPLPGVAIKPNHKNMPS